MKKLRLASLGLLLSSVAFGEGNATVAAPVLNSGDTAWMLMATAMVMLMTPVGLALF